MKNTVTVSAEEARRRFDTGHVIAAIDERQTCPLWRHVASGWARSFDELTQGLENPVFLRPLRERRTHDEAAGHIFRREAFEIGNLSAEHFTRGRTYPGDLPGQYVTDLQRDVSRHNEAYLVRSYETVIAWVLPGGTVIMPPVRYSQTTTQHQHLTARALGVSFSATDGSFREGKGKTPYTSRKGW